MAIEKRAFKGTVVGFVSYFVSFARSIVLVPILLKHWGNAHYGVWLALFAVWSIFQTLDSGHQLFVGNKINAAWAKADELGILISSSLVMGFLLVVVQAGLACGILLIGKVPDLLGTTPTFVEQSHAGVILLLFIGLCGACDSCLGLLSKLYIASGLYHRSLYWSIALQTSQLVTTAVIAALGGSLFAAGVGWVIVTVGLSGLNLAEIRSRFDSHLRSLPTPSLTVGWSNLSRSIFLTVNIFFQKFCNQGIVLFLSTLLTASVIPSFTTIKTLTSPATQTNGLFLYPVLPDMVRFHSQRDGRKLNAIFAAHWFLTGFLINAGILLMIPIVQRIYEIWTRGSLAFNEVLFYALGVAVVILNFGDCLITYVFCINNLRAQLIISGSRCAVLAPLAIISVQTWGINGIGLAVVLAEIVCSVGLAGFLANRQLNQIGSKLNIVYFLFGLMPILVIGTVMGAIHFALVSHILGTVLGFGLLLIIGAIYWKRLPPELQEKLRSLLPSALRR